MNEPLYSLNNVRQRFGERLALNVPHLLLEKGKIYGLLGPNGAGKTTLMRLLAFMDAPAEGCISFEGREVTPDQRRRYRARVVWVPQTPVLFTGSLLYNVEYPMRLKGTPGRQRRARAMELLESVGLSHLAQASARRLSGGEAQRGSIARALAAGAEVILFDEPTANVDFRSRAEIMRIIHGLWKDRGLSLIVTTHDKALADELTQEEITLFEGEVIAQTPVAKSLVAGAPKEFAAVPVRLEMRDGKLYACNGKNEDLARFFQGRAAVVRGLAQGEKGGVLISLQEPGGCRADLLVSDGDAELAQGILLGSALYPLPDDAAL